ncbi:L-lactate permease [Alicyclobacillus acidoterrestris]|uniref:L-lactate permease n=1 Tax=Alicyclobacillus acidoterrestris (strain ATCC 49025 / DSM 3922 / CIP 106132 / NCIMB 13137 / GD3B) TaxID=1356854 RepID=T0CRQ3_ALIAG|nr:L-lactate permease [Alicyclobacillus acidoterrestris]EPZ42147.1 hypothetical protein N007_16030 [Alicyclobacillus acidoterrestris ATCC 49025]UNO50666.1 L-lactate permease [Alicyclobacillus acidoterrestris]
MPSWFAVLMSALPILVALILLIGFKVSSLRTAVCVYGLAVVLAAMKTPFQMPLVAIGLASIQGLLLSLVIVLVLIFGLLLYNVLQVGGAIETISSAFTRRAHLPVQQALLISAALGPFLEATSGFGIGIVIAAPLFLAVGFSPRKTVLLSLLTQTAVPWGALAVGTVINAELSNVSLHALGMTSALATIPLYLMYTVAVVLIYRLSWTQACRCFVNTLRQAYPAVVSTVGYIAMSTVMQKAGMINCISSAIAFLFGGSFLLVSPLIGGLGGFISGSNSAANAMFAPFQSAMAHKLHSSALLYATSQNVSAANMSYASPSRISLATVVSKQVGREGEFIRKVLPLSLAAVAIVIVFNVMFWVFIKSF